MKLTKLFLMDFVKESNGIEGYRVEPGHPLFDQHLEALIQAVGHGEEKEKITSAYVKALHKTLMKSLMPYIMGDPMEEGEYRTVQVFVGGHVPPKPEDVPKWMDRVIPLLDKASTEEECWNAHYAFETVHPFADGNGRLGRILLAETFVRIGKEPPIIKAEDRFQYYDDIAAWRKENPEWNA